jgi:hypothetical protein
MRIGLVDIDGHAAKKKWGATIYPNIALCKLSRYHKLQGDSVEWALPFEHYDIIYKSKIFNFTPADQPAYDANLIVCGGTGYNLNSKLPHEVDRLQPDYSIYPNIPRDYAYGFLTRGCPNSCRWCVVPRKEGPISRYMDVDDIAWHDRTNLILMDNNILAAGDYAVEQLAKIIERGYRVDFNQALDARLVDHRFARLLAQVRWLGSRIRFGCDTTSQIDDCERAMSLINGYGFKGQYFLYCMLNDSFKECYMRLSYWWEINHRCREQHSNYVYPFAQPYRSVDDSSRKIPQWQIDMAQWVNKKQYFQVTDFDNFSPRKGFVCYEYKKALM